jgi:steroid 5-alpha reductase family enzyme
MNTYILLGALGICLLASSMGFKKTVWFISIGYTLCILLLSITTIIIWNKDLQLFNYFQLIGLGFWASRLGFFIVQRERNQTYLSAVKDQTDASQQQPLGVKVIIWISVCVLYTCMFYPSLASLVKQTNSQANIISWIGVAVLWIGILVEGVADFQKSLFKKSNPRLFCNTGLYSWVRCPNYLGEIMVWTGNIIVGISFFNYWWEWVMAFVGWACIVLIMMGSTKRLEIKQEERYGGDSNYQNYIKRVPVLFPWIPIYTLKNINVYLE